MKEAAALLIVAAGMLACGEPETASLELVGRVATEPPDCTAKSTDVVVGVGLFDVNAGDFFAPLLAISHVPGPTTGTGLNEVIVQLAEAFVTDADGNVIVPSQVLPVAGTVFNESIDVPANIFATLVSNETAASLAEQLSLSSPGVRAHVEVHVALTGEAPPPPSRYSFLPPRNGTGDPQPRAPGPVTSNEIIVPLDLCAGCLVPRCTDGERIVAEGCFLGVDKPAHCERNP